jgi:Cu(I)/Ag(I) efflux system membrane fusion protein
MSTPDGPRSDRPDEGAPETPGPRPLTRWQKFRLVVKVVELRLRFVALMAATGLVFAYWDTLWNYYEKYTRPHEEAVAAASESEYFCPMHPSVVQEQPGNCPICGMPLSRRKKGEKAALPAGVVARVQLAPHRVAQAGIRTVEVAAVHLAQTLTTVGSVGFDERRLARISSRVKGLSRIETLAVNFTGTPVKAGDVLAEIYSPELYQAVRELLLARQRAAEPPALDSLPGRPAPGAGEELLRLASEKLRLWGITQEQIDEILRTGKAAPRMPILAPQGGVVVRKNVVQGQYVAEGDPLFEIADLSHVWILAQVYEDQVGLVRVSQPVEASVEAYPGEVFKGQVAFKDPALNPTTRTLNVRFDLANPDGRLQPGMFATVTLKTPLEETAPFRARIAAAKPRRNAAEPTPAEQDRCPVTHAKLGSMGDPIPVQLASRRVWVCCAGCPDKLKADADHYLATLDAPAASEIVSVPESAVIDTGEKKIVYVEAQPGVFEGREVVLGGRVGDRFPVIEGLARGEKVAAAGAFLIDAESRLNQAEAAPAPAPPPPAGERARSAAASGAAHRH